MEKLNYKQAYDKIIQAYFKDEIKPMSPMFCFCGTLAGHRRWGKYGEGDSGIYNREEYNQMEKALFIKLEGIYNSPMQIDEDYEEFLFEGMCAALEVLKEIHRSRGENVDEVPVFTKRKNYDTTIINY